MQDVQASQLITVLGLVWFVLVLPVNDSRLSVAGYAGCREMGDASSAVVV